jgi:hypothetical protein
MPLMQTLMIISLFLTSNIREIPRYVQHFNKKFLLLFSFVYY